MAKKVILNGNTIMDVTDTTATASDVAEGKIFYDADGVRTEGTAQGGGSFAPEFVSFYEYEGETLDLTGLDTSNVTSMRRMFNGCFELTSLDLSGFNTSNVTEMSEMFTSCEFLTSLDLSGFNTSNVETMGSMFEHCESLTSLDLSSFDTSNVIDFSFMFNGCSSLQELDIRNFDFSNNPSVQHMFNMVPSTCVIYVNQDAYDFLEDNYTNGNDIQLADLSMLQVVS